MATWFRRSYRRDGSWTSPRPRASSDRAIPRLCGFVAGQPVGFLEAIGARRPGGHRPLHGAPAAPVRSRAESWGASGEWLLRARRAHGTCGRPFLEAARDPERLAIAEVDAAHRRDPRAGRQPGARLGGRCMGRARRRAPDPPGGTTVAGGPRDRESRVRTHPARIDPV